LKISPEAINPVALGKTRAKQYALLKTSPKDCKLGDKVMCVQLHGDASFTGQGVVMESLGLSEYQLQIGLLKLLPISFY
jgi:probable 2-oxoglutarate dehydrogenase E1 component DHKTD1